MKRLVTLRKAQPGNAVAYSPRTVWTPQRGVGGEPRSCYLPAVTSFLKCTTFIPSIFAMSFCGWMYIVNALLGGAGIVCECEKNDDSFFNSFFFFPSSLMFGNTPSQVTFTNMPVSGRWFFWAMTFGPYNGGAGTIDAYWCYPQDTSFQTVSKGQLDPVFDPGPMEYFTFGNDVNNEWMDARFAGIKVWDAKLTPAELRAEMFSVWPVRTHNINRVLPCFTPNDTRDYSGMPGNRSATYIGINGAVGPPLNRVGYAPSRAFNPTPPVTPSLAWLTA